jgi:Neprosin
MLISRRGALAVGLTVAVVGGVGAWSLLGADAAQTKSATTAGSGTAATNRTAGSVPKAPPPGSATATAPGARTATASIEYLYRGARQQSASDGAYGSLTVGNPTVNAADDHSLAEIAVQSADLRQTVEVGWHVNPKLNGSTTPRLFVYYWVDGKPQCDDYKCAKFVLDSDAPKRPGDTVKAGDTIDLQIQHYGGVWWVLYNGGYVGYFPDSLWNNRYTKSGMVQWYGEITAATRASKTQMGNGLVASCAGAATFSDIGLVEGGSGSLTDIPDSNSYTMQWVNGSGFRYGGPNTKC